MPVLPQPSDQSSLGGIKENFEGPAEDDTQVDATEWNELVANVASHSRIAFSGEFAFSVSGGTVTLETHESVWGNSVFVAPEIVRNSDGNYTVTFPETVVDELGNEQAINFKCGFGNCEIDGFMISVKRESPNTCRVLVNYWSGGAAMDPNGIVWIFYRVVGS